MLTATFVGIGALCKDYGLSQSWAVIAAGAIWAGPAQVILVSGIGAKASALAVALTVCLSSVRMMPMVVSIMPYFRQATNKTGLLLLCAHIVSISSWAEGMKLLPNMPVNERIPFFLGLGFALIGCSMAAAGVGYHFASGFSPALSACLLFITPIFFLLTLFNNAKMPLDYLAIGAGMALLLIFAKIFPAFDLLFAGLGGGTASYFLAKRIKSS